MWLKIEVNHFISLRDVAWLIKVLTWFFFTVCLMKELRALLEAGLLSKTWISSSGFSSSIFNDSRLPNKGKCDAWKQTREGGVAIKNDYDLRQIISKHCHAILCLRFSRNYSLMIFLSCMKPTSRIRDNYHSNIMLLFRKLILFGLGWHNFIKWPRITVPPIIENIWKLLRLESNHCKSNVTQFFAYDSPDRNCGVGTWIKHSKTFA